MRLSIPSLIIAAFAAVAAVPAVASAHGWDGWDGPRRGWGWHRDFGPRFERPWGWGPRFAVGLPPPPVYLPRPVYVAPRPVYVAPPPVYLPPPAPIVVERRVYVTAPVVHRRVVHHVAHTVTPPCSCTCTPTCATPAP